MTVYVDNARIPARVGNIRGRWSHLTADTREELLAFGKRIGLKSAWFQTCKANRRRCPPETCPHFHFDVTESKREQAIAAGAQPMDIRQRGELIAARRKVVDAARLVGAEPDGSPHDGDPGHGGGA